jgi:hypothetical protein
MKESHIAFTTIKAGKTGISTTAELLTNGVRRKNSGRQGGSIVAATHPIASGIICRDSKEADCSRIMGSVVSNLESCNAMTSGDPFKMPEYVKAISGTCHGTTIHMSTGRGITMKKRFLVSELMIDLRTCCLHGSNPKVKGMECTGSRVQSISACRNKVHVGAFPHRDTGRMKTLKKVNVWGDLISVRGRIIREEWKIVIIIGIIIM